MLWPVFFFCTQSAGLATRDFDDRALTRVRRVATRDAQLCLYGNSVFNSASLYIESQRQADQT